LLYGPNSIAAFGAESSHSMVETPESGHELQDPPDEPKTILAAVDASANAGRVVSLAARLTRSMPRATVHLVHVFRTSRLDRARMGTPEGNTDLIADAKEQLEAHVRAARRQCRAAITGHFALGEPAAEILRLCHGLDVDLLVVGTHDYVGFERFLLGSVAETLMRKAGCPVLIVRPKAHHTD
jgi:nucleotide-binding universal stress UspA family protein